MRMTISDLDYNFQLLKITECKIGEICPPAALCRKWFTQTAQIHILHHFRNASKVTKFLGEKYRLNRGA